MSVHLKVSTLTSIEMHLKPSKHTVCSFIQVPSFCRFCRGYKMFDPIIYTKCIDFAARKHRDQRRKDAEKTPYINHPIGNV